MPGTGVCRYGERKVVKEQTRAEKEAQRSLLNARAMCSTSQRKLRKLKWLVF